jgi:hypothetical protein
MNEDQARELVEPLIKGSTITEIQDYGEIYAIHYVNDEYYKSKNIMDMAIGAGPTFIEKDSKKITQTGSGRGVAQYVEAYRACGDFFASLGNSVSVYGTLKEIDTPKTILSVKKICGYSTSESKNVVETITKGGEVELNFSSATIASEAVLKLANLGLLSKQSWESQC